VVVEGIVVVETTVVEVASVVVVLAVSPHATTERRNARARGAAVRRPLSAPVTSGVGRIIPS
jgi:hypothetical protein